MASYMGESKRKGFFFKNRFRYAVYCFLGLANSHPAPFPIALGIKSMQIACSSLCLQVVSG